MGRPGDHRPKTLFRRGAQRRRYGRCDMAQRQEMPALWTRRLALPAFVDAAPGTETHRSTHIWNHHTNVAARNWNVQCSPAVSIPCLLHNKITNMQTAKGGPPNRVVALYLQTLLGTQGSPLLIAMPP